MSNSLTAAELREALGISEATFYRWLRDGRLEGTKVGKCWRFPQRVVDQFLSAGEEATQDARTILETRLVALGRAKKEVTAMMAQARTDGQALLEGLIHHALERRASDLHLEPRADGIGTRERIDGNLTSVDPPLPMASLAAIHRAVADLAGLDASHQGGENGRFFLRFQERPIDVHATMFPTSLGPSISLRLLDPKDMGQVADLGFSEPVQQQLEALVSSTTQGVFLVNGPTGSGKSTTLYTILNALNQTTPALKIMTVEDPVEFHLDGLVQANVSEQFGFLDGFRAMQQSDVDVALVSELRDPESMAGLFRLAQTGRRAYSVLHAPDAPTALHRLLTVGGLSPHVVSETLIGILDQRLVARSCTKCRELIPITRTDARKLGLPTNTPVAHNPGCKHCQLTGTHGRIPIGSILDVSPALARVLESGTVGVDELRQALPDDYRDWQHDLRSRVKAGEVRAEDALQLTK